MGPLHPETIGHRGPGHRRWRQHGRRGLRGIGRLGSLRLWGRRHAWDRAGSRNGSYTAEEQAALGDAMATLGDSTFDIYLNGQAYWRNVPCELSGITSLAATRSSRSGSPTGRARSWAGSLKLEEVQHFTGTARRIAAVLMLTGK